MIRKETDEHIYKIPPDSLNQYEKKLHFVEFLISSGKYYIYIYIYICFD